MSSPPLPFTPRSLSTLSARDYFETNFPHIHLIDVRAPVEFDKSHFPLSVNAPILDDKERALVGTTYRQRGRAKAEELGFSLVSGAKKEQRIAQWAAEIRQNPGAAIVCARGGLRSQIAQQWLDDYGMQIPRILGGYKSVRNYLLNLIESASASIRFITIRGLTGSGKTELLNSLRVPDVGVLDLERIANHRGSAFGGLGAQPMQATFENALAFSLFGFMKNPVRYVLVEGESRSIGRVWLPESLYEAMQSCSSIELQATVEERSDRIIKEYIHTPVSLVSEDERNSTCDHLFSGFFHSLFKIKKRLGNERYESIRQCMEEARILYLTQNKPEVHRPWVAMLLTEYYDPSYQWQLKKNPKATICSGTFSEIQSFIENLTLSTLGKT